MLPKTILNASAHFSGRRVAAIFRRQPRFWLASAVVMGNACQADACQGFFCKLEINEMIKNYRSGRSGSQ